MKRRNRDAAEQRDDERLHWCRRACVPIAQSYTKGGGGVRRVSENRQGRDATAGGDYLETPGNSVHFSRASMNASSRRPHPRGLFVAVLLLLTLGLAGVLALQARRTFLDHRATAERVLRDNARLAAARFAQRVGMELYYTMFWPTVDALSHARAGAPGMPLPSPAKLAGGLDSAAASFLKGARYGLRYELARGRLAPGGGG